MRRSIVVLLLGTFLICSPASAQTTCSNPASFQNGTPANATAVNNAFGSLATCVNNVASGGTLQGVTITGTSPTVPLTIKGGFGTEVMRMAYGSSDFHSLYASFNGSNPSANYLSFLLDNGTGGGQSEVLRLTGSGNIGVGTTSPSAMLDLVSTNSIYALRVFENGNSSNPAFWVAGSSVINNVATGANSAASMIYVNKDSGSTRSINAAGSINSNGADYAEYFYQQSPGRLMPGNLVGLNSETGKAEAARAGSALIGIVSIRPGFVGNDLFDTKNPQNTILVGLTGQLEAQVSNEGGPISIGDRIAASSVPGVGKRAGYGEATIGVAMTPWKGPGRGQVTVLLSSSNNGETIRHLAADVALLKSQLAMEDKRLSQLEARTEARAAFNASNHSVRTAQR